MALSAKDALNIHIGEAVKKRRVELGYSLEQLAALADVSKGALANYEAGKQTPGTDKLMAIAYVLRMRVDELLPKEYASFVDSPFLRLVREMAVSNPGDETPTSIEPRKQNKKTSRPDGREGGFPTNEASPADTDAVAA
jgi:transcriptional regulator with XRE-family HTH domain